MKLSLAKNYSNWIAGLTKEQFDILIKEFIKIYFKIETVVIVDGTGDGGTDVKILENGNKRRTALQITIEKNVYYKLKKDIAKIARLIEDHSYSDTFYFFYSSGAAESNIDDLFDLAREQGINLIAFDSKVLGEYIDKPNYQSVRHILREILGNIIVDDDVHFDKFEKMKYDLICYNEDSLALKNRTITSYILFELYVSGPNKIEDINQKLKDKFQIKDVEYINRLVIKLVSEKRISRIGIGNEVILTEGEFYRIDAIREELDFQEQYFVNSISELLHKCGLRENVKEIINEIRELYISNYTKDYLEINEITDDSEFRVKTIEEFNKYLHRILKDREKTAVLAREIIEICSYNNFLQKLGAGQLFSKLIKSTEIDQYLNRQPKTVYLDASVLIDVICVLANEHSAYNNVFFSLAKDLVSYYKKGAIKFNLYVSKNYVREAALHLQNAINLIPFTRLEFFKKLGTASNIFYNFYLFQENNGELEEDIANFEDYMLSLGINPGDLSGYQLYDYLTESLIRILNDSSITVFEFKRYSAIKFNEMQKQLTSIYDIRKKIRTQSAITNDTLMLCELYDDEVDKIDPTFLTLDNTFYHFRKRHHELHPNAIYWHLFRPGKYLDHLSLMNFKINSEVISKDIYTIMEDEFDFQNKVKYLNDVLVRLADLKTTAGIKLTKGLADLKDNEIFSVNKMDKEKTEIDDQEPIDEFVIGVSKYFMNRIGKYDFETFKTFLSKEDQVEIALDFFKKELPNFISRTSETPVEIYKKLEGIIEQTKSAEGGISS